MGRVALSMEDNLSGLMLVPRVQGMVGSGRELGNSRSGGTGSQDGLARWEADSRATGQVLGLQGCRRPSMRACAASGRCARDVSPQTEVCGRCPLPRVEEKPSSTFLFPPGTPENPSPQHVPAPPPSHCGQESLLGISCPGRHLVFCTVPRVLPLALTTSEVLGYTSKGAETRWHQH